MGSCFDPCGNFPPPQEKCVCGGQLDGAHESLEQGGDWTLNCMLTSAINGTLFGRMGMAGMIRSQVLR